MEIIEITNDKGCLSKEDIDRMVNEAEKYREEDERRRMNQNRAITHVFTRVNRERCACHVRM